jgi:serine protease Do
VSRSAALAKDLQDLFAGVAEEVRPAVVFISSTRTIPVPEADAELEQFFQGRRATRQRSLGSGVIIDPRGFVLTNHHVVGEAEELLVKSWDGQVWPARVVQKEESADIALLKVEAPNLRSVALGNSDSIRVGHWVVAIGSPFGLTQTVSTGIVSAVGRSDLGILPYESFIQTDASINQGNSGGPLVDLGGRLVGINTAIFSNSCGTSLGIGFAVPINLAQALVEKWIQGKSSSYLGIKPLRMDDDAARYFGLEEDRGVLVEAVAADSPAERGGLKPMDILTRFNGARVRDENHFRYLLARADAGHPLDVEVLRGPEKPPRRQELKVTLSEVEPRSSAPPAAPVADTPRRARMLGITVSPLTADLARQLSAPEGTAGVAVIDVDLNSTADAKGLREGDIILEVNQQPVKDVAEVMKAMNGNGKDGAPPSVVLLRILRNGTDSGYKFLPR